MTAVPRVARRRVAPVQWNVPPPPLQVLFHTHVATDESGICWWEMMRGKLTSSSAIAEGPRDALSQLKSCQLLHNRAKNHIAFHVV